MPAPDPTNGDTRRARSTGETFEPDRDWEQIAPGQDLRRLLRVARLVTPTRERDFNKLATAGVLRILAGALPIDDREDCDTPYRVELSPPTDKRAGKIELRRVERPDPKSVVDTWPPDRWLLWQLKTTKARQFDRLIRRGISLLKKQGGHILTINELGFPGANGDGIRGPLGQPALESFKEYFRLLLKEKVVKATDKPFYALLGSMHCLAEMTNTMPIYYFGGKAHRPGGHGNENFVCNTYYKKTAAFRLCEFTNIPSVRQLACLKIGEVSILPMICLDLYDTTQVLSIVYRNLLCDFYPDLARKEHEETRVDVVVINSLGMTEHDDLDDALQAFSRLAGAVVILASSNKDLAFRRGYYLGEDFPEVPAPKSSGKKRTPTAADPRFLQNLGSDFTLFGFHIETFRKDLKASASFESRSEIAKLLNLGRIVGL